MAKRSELTETQYAALKNQVLSRDSWRCRNPQCKRRDGLHVHHIIFRSQRGPDKSWNLATLCNLCHDLVHGKLLSRKLIILAKTGNPEDKPNADIGLRFITE